MATSTLLDMPTEVLEYMVSLLLIEDDLDQRYLHLPEPSAQSKLLFLLHKNARLATVCKPLLEILARLQPEISMGVVRFDEATAVEQRGVWRVKAVRYSRHHPKSWNNQCRDSSIIGSLGSLSMCTHLRMLDLTSTYRTWDYAPLRACFLLEKLELYLSPALDYSVLAELPRLRDLNLGRCGITSAELKSIGKCVALQKLDLYRNEELDDISCLATCHCLEHLNLEETSSLSDITAIAHFPALKIVTWHLHHAPVTDLRALALAPKLEVVDLSGLVDLEDISALASSSTLRYVKCRHPCVDMADVDTVRAAGIKVKVMVEPECVDVDGSDDCWCYCPWCTGVRSSGTRNLYERQPFSPATHNGLPWYELPEGLSWFPDNEPDTLIY